MKFKPERIFYVLSAVVLTAAAFIITPSQNQDVTEFQKVVKGEFTKASIQVFGDQPIFDETLLVIESITEFYQRSADALIALLTPTHGEDEVISKVAIDVYSGLKVALNPKTYTSPVQIGLISHIMGDEPQVLGSETVNLGYDLVIPDNFMQEEPIVLTQNPDKPLAYSAIKEDLSPVWANMRDGVTGQVYCVGIFNAEVNRYIGPCVSDYQ